MLRPWKLEIQLDERSDKAVYLQIADAVIGAISAGRLKSGDALPGSRQLALLLNVNRNTVVEALNVLMQEEWIVTMPRKGAFIAEVLPHAKQRGSRRLPPHKATPPQKRPGAITFDDGHPDSKIAPVAGLARAYRQLFQQQARWQMMGYGEATGTLAFRVAIAQMLNQQRGMRLDEAQLCITRGSQMALYLAAHSLLEKGDYILVENPGYRPAWEAFARAGAQMLPVPVDQEGVLVPEIERLLKRYKRIKALYLTPHHQYPTTVTLSLQRRLALVGLSQQYGFTIIEDDYDNEFHFGYRPVLPLSSFTGIERYLYIGTLSKIVAPALRIGYLAGDRALVAKAGQLRKLIDVQGDNIMEQAVLQLIQEGTLKKHIRKATVYYRSKRDLCAQLLTHYLDGAVQYNLPEGGLACWLRFEGSIDMLSLQQKLLQKGVSIIPSSRFDFDGRYIPAVRLGYGSPGPDDLEAGIKAIARQAALQ